MVETARDNVQVYLGQVNAAEPEALADFVSRFVEPAFWASLVSAAREMFPVQPESAPRFGLVLADDPLLGLAAASLCSRSSIHVPVPGGRHRRLRRVDRLVDAINMHYQLRIAMRDCGVFPDAAARALLLAWDSRDPFTAREALAAELASAPADHGGVVCLCNRRNGSVTADPAAVLVDVSDPVGLLSDALWRLDLPGLDLSDVDDASRWLECLLRLPGMTLEKVITGLSTPAHGDFLRHAQHLKTREWPEVTKLFDQHVLDPQELHPRHAASLFLVSHFANLTPRQFIELGDELAQRTPRASVPRGQSAPPGRLSDRVLADCGIFFSGSQRGAAVAILGAFEGEDDDSRSGGSVGRAEHLRWLFEQKAPLLRERYLRHLGARVLLGHASWAVASDYIRHEARALKAAVASDDTFTLTDRLRLAVYGGAREASVTGAAANDAEEALNIEVFIRALERVPALLDEVTEATAGDRLLEGVRALCSPDPTRTSLVSPHVMRQGSAWLFWSLYVRYVGQVGLRDYTSLFETGGDARAWRRALVVSLCEIVGRAAAGDERRYLDALDRPGILVALIGDLAREAPRMVNEGDEKARWSLATVVLTHYLRQAVHGVRWRDVSVWQEAATQATPAVPTDLALARLLLSREGGFDLQWIGDARVRGIGPSDDHEAASSHRQENGRAMFELCYLSLDALVGCSSFGDRASLALDIWLFSAMPIGLLMPGFSFGNARFWWSLSGGDNELDEPLRVAFRGAVSPLFDVFPLLVVMAATRRGTAPGVAFSQPLQDWLLEKPSREEPSPAERLMTLARQALQLQKEWRQAHETFVLRDVAWPAVKALIEDRVAALQAFIRALQPLAQASRPSALASASKPEAKPAPAANLAPASVPEGPAARS